MSTRLSLNGNPRLCLASMCEPIFNEFDFCVGTSEATRHDGDNDAARLITEMVDN